MNINKKDLHILIVDDEKTAHQLYKLMLKPEGHTLYHAENGKEAVDVFSDNKNIDLILMDIKMPIMDGYKAAREIRKISREVVIVAQTAYSLAADRAKAREAGCNAHLAKPVDRLDLLETIAKLCG